MRNRGAALLALCGLAFVIAACGYREQSVVDNYFRAVNAEDSQTLSSFAVVNMQEKVDSWEITSASDEIRQPAALPALTKKVDAVQADLDANKKAYNAYFLDHPQEVDEVRDLVKAEADIPKRLATYAEEWQQFVDKEKELKKALSDAQNAVSHEKKNVTLSVGADAVGDVSEVVDKQLEMTLTIKGEPKGYVMKLRRYEAGEEGGRRIISRWVVFDLQPA
jgi:hypothetical protein